jgi:hypothetical protein
LLSEENTYDEYENDLGITAIALYDYQAGEMLPRAGHQFLLPWALSSKSS